jgi:hypothetical protein
LAIQEETRDKFGEIAVREKYLTKGQVEQLLKEQEDNYIFFGEALVHLQITTGTITSGLRISG